MKHAWATVNRSSSLEVRGVAKLRMLAPSVFNSHSPTISQAYPTPTLGINDNTAMEWTLYNDGYQETVP